MFNEFEALIRYREAETLNSMVKGACWICGKEILKNYRKVTVVGLFATAGLYCACNVQAFIKAKEAEIPVEIDSLAKLPQVLVNTSTDGQSLIFSNPVPPSGDSRGLEVNISKLPPFTQDVDGVNFSSEPQSVFDGIVHKNGSERARSLQSLGDRFYTIGSGDQALVFVVKNP